MIELVDCFWNNRKFESWSWLVVAKVAYFEDFRKALGKVVNNIFSKKFQFEDKKSARGKKNAFLEISFFVMKKKLKYL